MPAMKTVMTVIAVTALAALALPASSSACLPGLCGCHACGLPFAGCLCPPCGVCHHPAPACTCGSVAPPFVQTRYRQEQYTTYRDVPRTQIRRETFTEQVPVTSYERVTETVYVPQQVTKLVPRTVMQSQTRYRDVAVQSTERIAETHTRLVPQQTVGFVPAMRPAGCNGAAPILSPGIPVVPAPTTMTPGSGALPSMPPITVSPRDVHGQAVPQYDDVGWTPVQRRNTSTSSSVTSPASAPRRGTSMFRPAPSAATVWQSKF